MKAASRPRLPALTSLRYPAALAIVLYHAGAMRGLEWASAWLREIALVGYVAVTFFFVLSGFVLVYTYADRPLALGAFWRARLARLYPVYLLALVFTAPFFFWSVAHPDKMPIPGLDWMSRHVALTSGLVLATLQSWVPQAALGWNAPAWAVSTEIFFYALFPFLLARLLRASGRTLAVIAAACWLASLAVGVSYAVLLPDGIVADQASDAFWLNLVKFNPLVRFPEFVVGMACGGWFVRRTGDRRLATPLVLGGAALVAAAAASSRVVPYVVMHTGLLTPAFAAIIVGVALRPRFVSLLEARWATVLGESSYALYLFHSFILGMFFYAGADPARLPTPARVIPGALVALAVALLVTRLYEEPLGRRLRGQARAVPSKAGVAV